MGGACCVVPQRQWAAFDLLELDGRDLRHEPIEKRKALLAKLLRGSHLSIVLNEHFEQDGAIVYREHPESVYACSEGQRSCQ